DFPNRTVMLTRPEVVSTAYPALAKNLPGFVGVLQALESGNEEGAIMQLAWDVERFVDARLMRRASDDVARTKSSLRMTLIEKLLTAAGERAEDLAQAIDSFVRVRNQVAHG